ncbi:hypothetical protein TBR22_A52100 [Luteitalea sp. TBR-22]|nr:hypothetical protein TBR22_A52100 [Luteitalea sp. TBR-22]
MADPNRALLESVVHLLAPLLDDERAALARPTGRHGELWFLAAGYAARVILGTWNVRAGDARAHAERLRKHYGPGVFAIQECRKPPPLDMDVPWAGAQGSRHRAHPRGEVGAGVTAGRGGSSVSSRRQPCGRRRWRG